MSGFGTPPAGVTPRVFEEWGEELAAALGPERAAWWSLPRSPYRPALAVRRGEGGKPIAALLTSGRPATAAVKVVDLWWEDSDAGLAGAASLVDALLEARAAAGDAAVKWEVAPGATLPDLAVARGFVPMRTPWGAKGTERFAGHVRWLVEVPHAELGYYAQTTLYTCGAVAGLMAVEAAGVSGFAGAAADDRDREIGFWREATNHPACEPVGLAVRLREEIAVPVGGGAPVAVALDHEAPVLLEDYEGFEHDYRAELQEHSARRAALLGVPVARERLSMAELEARLNDGWVALLLVDEEPMHGVTGAHWIVAHAARDGMFVLEDPWVEDAAGESWVDTHDMPVAASDLDRMVRWGPEGYRGIVLLRRA
ncbi:peptidase C39 family protein [Demequina subtropica]|uniref:peptidase C39 family protein n=1 Tax=Demequina subtropica TaxID=1638989 RepID=UPI0007845A3E|nr:peptidase C39 family protein [Demequina subtropica]